MNRKTLFLIQALFFLSLQFTSICSSASNEQEFKLIEQGNQAYNQGLFDQAIANYEKVIQSGYSSSELYFNLGNAYFKINDIANAILFYERAKRLDPGNESIEFNLGLANSRTVDKIEQVPDLFLIKWWKSIIYTTSLDNWARISIVTFVLSLILIGIFLLSSIIFVRKICFYTGIVVFLLTVFSVFVSYQKYQYMQTSNEAIVFDPTVVMKSSPSEKGVDLFIVHEGTKIFIIDQVGDWYEAKIANGSVGWLKTDTFKKI